MPYRLITTIQVYEGLSHEDKPLDDLVAGSKLTELDTGKEFVATIVGAPVGGKLTLRWEEVEDSGFTALGSQLVQLNINTGNLLAEMRRANLIAETGWGVQVSIADTEG